MSSVLARFKFESRLFSAFPVVPSLYFISELNTLLAQVCQRRKLKANFLSGSVRPCV